MKIFPVKLKSTPSKCNQCLTNESIWKSHFNLRKFMVYFLAFRDLQFQEGLRKQSNCLAFKQVHSTHRYTIHDIDFDRFLISRIWLLNCKFYGILCTLRVLLIIKSSPNIKIPYVGHKYTHTQLIKQIVFMECK